MLHDVFGLQQFYVVKIQQFPLKCWSLSVKQHKMEILMSTSTSEL